MSGSVKAVSSPQASPSSSSASSPPSMPPPRPRELRHCHAAAAGRVVIIPLLLLLQPPPHGQHPPALGGSSSWAHPTAPTTHPPTPPRRPAERRAQESAELELPPDRRDLCTRPRSLGSANRGPPGWGRGGGSRDSAEGGGRAAPSSLSLRCLSSPLGWLPRRLEVSSHARNFFLIAFFARAGQAFCGSTPSRWPAVPLRLSLAWLRLPVWFGRPHLTARRRWPPPSFLVRFSQEQRITGTNVPCFFCLLAADYMVSTICL
jgi:hypothetical protein